MSDTVEETQEQATTNTTSTPQTLEERVAYLEAQNEGIKKVGRAALILIAVIAIAVVSNTWSPLSGVTTKGIVLQDQSGTAKAALLVPASGHVALVPFNYLERLPVIQPGQKSDFSGLGVYDSQGRLRLIIGVDVDDNPILQVTDAQGKVIWSPSYNKALPSSQKQDKAGLTGSSTPRPSSTPQKDKHPKKDNTGPTSATPGTDKP